MWARVERSGGSAGAGPVYAGISRSLTFPHAPGPCTNVAHARALVRVCACLRLGAMAWVPAGPCRAVSCRHCVHPGCCVRVRARRVCLRRGGQFELNGGGYKGNYTASTSGDITIETEDGGRGTPVGSIDNADSQFTGTFALKSRSGDIDLTFLPSAV